MKTIQGNDSIVITPRIGQNMDRSVKCAELFHKVFNIGPIIVRTDKGISLIDNTGTSILTPEQYKKILGER